MKGLVACLILLALHPAMARASIQQEFTSILTLSSSEKWMVNTPEPYSYEDYLTFALMASGVSVNEVRQYKRVVDQIAKVLAAAMKAESVSEKPVKRAEFILQRLHQNFLGDYVAEQTEIDGLIENRNFNCVSSAVLYNIVCRKFGIQVAGVVVPDHAFSQLRLDDKKYDIETTIRYGFDPTSKKELIDQFGKLTGFIYIPPQQYEHRDEVNDRQMLALIYSNRYKILSDQGRYKEATRMVYVGWRLAGDLPRTLNTWEHALGNYIIGLDRDGRFADASYVINEAKRQFPDLQSPVELRPMVYTNWSYERLQEKRYDEAIGILEQGLMFSPRDPKLLGNLKAAYLEMAQELGHAGRFTEAHAIIDKGRRAFPDEEKFIMKGVNLYIDETEKLPMNRAEALYRKGLEKYPGDNVLREAFTLLYIKPAQKLSEEGKYDTAIQILERGERVLPTSAQIRKVKAATLNNWGLNLVERKQFRQAKQTIDRGLAIAPKDETLLNNWDVIMLDWAKAAFEGNDFELASTILKEGLKRSHSRRARFRKGIEAYYNDTAIKFLEKGDLKKGIRRLQEGLKLVPDSEVMKKNLELARQQGK